MSETYNSQGEQLTNRKYKKVITVKIINNIVTLIQINNSITLTNLMTHVSVLGKGKLIETFILKKF